MSFAPTIHVIMPVYNCERFIETAIQSVLSQPYPHIDVLIVNDGSTDSTPDICDILCDMYENVSVFHKTNAGVSAARNDGIERILTTCKENDYIAFCDADDLWAKDAIKDNLFNEEHDLIVLQSCSMSFDGTMCTEKHGNVNVSSPQIGGKSVIWAYPFHFCAFLYNVRMFKEFNIRFDVTLKYNEDKVLLMQMLYLASSISHFDRMLYLYRANPASAMHIRKYGIDYYTPLIAGWLRSDEYMKRYANEQRGVLRAGKIISMIYVIDTAKEHYWHFKNRKTLNNFITKLPIYNDFLQLDPSDVMPNQAKEHKLFMNHPTLFMLKHYMYGVAVKIGTVIRNIPAIYNILYNRKYHIPNKYI